MSAVPHASCLVSVWGGRGGDPSEGSPRDFLAAWTGSWPPGASHCQHAAFWLRHSALGSVPFPHLGLAHVRCPNGPTGSVACRARSLWAGRPPFSSGLAGRTPRLPCDVPPATCPLLYMSALAGVGGERPGCVSVTAGACAS